MILRRRGCTFGVKAWIAIQTLPVHKERALGEALLRDAARFENTEVAAYVDRVGARLGGGFRVVVIAGNKGEPVALPGQIVTVPAGFLLAVEDEAEFAGMLAHAMGHSALRPGATGENDAYDSDRASRGPDANRGSDAAAGV